MANSFELPPLPDPWGHFEFQLDAGDGQWVEAEDGKSVFSADQMRAYALAAVEAEREACAKVCKDHQKMRDETGHPREASTARKLAEMIRARGKS